MGENIDVTRLIDRQPFGGLLIGVLTLCLLVTLADGYNITVLSFAAPSIVKDWHVSRAALGPLLSSALWAGLIGPFLFGALADRIGRRYSMVLSMGMIGIFGVISGYCTSLAPLVVTRFLGGVGMSGALAVTVAAINEFAPRRLRATFVTIVFSGTTIGSGLPGLVAPALLAHHHWPSLFFLGGFVPLGLSMAVYVLLPESPKFLCLRAGRSAELAALLRRLNPQLQIPADARYVLGEQTHAARSSSLAQLFAGKLAYLTPLLWLGSFLAMTVFHSFNTWVPTLLPDMGVSFKQASFTVATFQFVGTLGGWCIARPLDRFGMMPCTILYVLGVLAFAALGALSGAGSGILLLSALAGFCVLGLHFAQVSCISNIYPTAVRALGVGWFMLFARVGGAVGPLVVGVLAAKHASIGRLFYLAMLPLGVGTAASIAVTLIYQANYHRRAPDAAALAVAPGNLKSGCSFGS